MKVTIAATQMSFTTDTEVNVKKATKMVETAAQKGAQVILLSELFKSTYFCQTESYDNFHLAEESYDNAFFKHFMKLAERLNVVLPISFFEKAGNVYYNSIMVIDADGTNLGIYRKSHIPTGTCYEEKFYFTPGDTGFKVFNTKYGRLGVGICWDQWFSETARILTLLGAEFLLFPTAIGSEPILPTDSKTHWQNVMCGHAAANIIPVIASNRVGLEKQDGSEMTFYGSSFIANEEGTKVEELNRTEEGMILHTFDLEAINEKRRSWGIFRDRRVDLYTGILKHDLSI